MGIVMGKGVPLLGVPENPSENSIISWTILLYSWLKLSLPIKREQQNLDHISYFGNILDPKPI